MDCGETLYAGCNMRQEWRLCDVVQTLELSNKDSGRKEALLSDMYKHYMPTTTLMHIYLKNRMSLITGQSISPFMKAADALTETQHAEL